MPSSWRNQNPPFGITQNGVFDEFELQFFCIKLNGFVIIIDDEGDMGYMLFQRLNEEAFIVSQLNNVKSISNRNISRTSMNKILPE